MSADLRKLAQVFYAAKASFLYASDLEAYGVSEHWCSPDEIRGQLSAKGVVLGDCDDFASLCVFLARKTGIPARFLMCLTEQGESHLVCEVDGWILDNRQDEVRSRDDLCYTWVAISGFAAGEPWHSIIELN